MQKHKVALARFGYVTLIVVGVLGCIGSVEFVVSTLWDGKDWVDALAIAGMAVFWGGVAMIGWRGVRHP